MAEYRKIADCPGGPLKAWHYLRGRGYEIESAPDGYTLRDSNGSVVNVQRWGDELFADGPVRAKRKPGGKRRRTSVVLTAQRAEGLAAWFRGEGLTTAKSTRTAVIQGIDALLRVAEREAAQQVLDQIAALDAE